MGETVVADKAETGDIDYLDVFDSIIGINLQDCHVTLCLASFTDDEAIPCFEQLQVHEDVEKEFSSILGKIFRKYRKDRYTNGLLFPEYASTSKPPSYQIERFDLSEHQTLLEQLNPLKALTEIDVFEADARFVSAIRFYVMVVQTPVGDPVYCFRFHTSKKTLAQSGFLTLWKRDGSYYSRVEEPVFLFDDEIDCICRSGVMFIFNKNNFVQMFHFLEELQEIAKETLEKFGLRIPIKNFDALLRACQGNLNKMRALQLAAKQPYIDKITIDHIKIVIAESVLPLQTEVVGGQEMIVYDEKNPWVILHLLNDKYLKSLLTGQNYEVNGKRTLSK